MMVIPILKISNQTITTKIMTPIMYEPKMSLKMKTIRKAKRDKTHVTPYLRTLMLMPSPSILGFFKFILLSLDIKFGIIE